MDQQKIGRLLKILRNEKKLTQEQFAEIINVSNRTVSRWENGNNLPDIDVMIQISDFYEIDLRELLDGERKSENMKKDIEETVLKAVDYVYEETQRYNKRVHVLLVAGVILWFCSQFISHTSLMENNIINACSEFASGAGCGLIVFGIIATSCYGQKLKAFKKRLIKRQ